MPGPGPPGRRGMHHWQCGRAALEFLRHHDPAFDGRTSFFTLMQQNWVVSGTSVGTRAGQRTPASESHNDWNTVLKSATQAGNIPQYCKDPPNSRESTESANYNVLICGKGSTFCTGSRAHLRNALRTFVSCTKRCLHSNSFSQCETRVPGHVLSLSLSDLSLPLADPEKTTGCNFKKKLV